MHQKWFKGDGKIGKARFDENADDTGSTIYELLSGDHRGNRHRVWREEFPFVAKKVLDYPKSVTSKGVNKLTDIQMKAQAKRKQPPQHLVIFRMAKEVLQYCKSNPTTVISQFLANL